MKNDEELLERLFRSARADAAPAAAKARALAAASAAPALAAVGAASASSKSPTAIVALSLAAIVGVGGAGDAVHATSAPPAVTAEAPAAVTTVDHDDSSSVAPASSPFSKPRALPAGRRDSPPAATCQNVSLPDEPPTVCSTAGDPLLLELVNTCGDETVDLYWVDFRCKEVFWKQLAPGETVVQSTFVTHPWRIRDHLSGRLLKTIAPSQRSAPDAGTKTLPPFDVVVGARDHAVEAASADARCSEAGLPMRISVLNEREEAFEMYWLDYDCKEIFKGAVLPGARWLQNTQDAHRWRVRDRKTRELLKEFAVDPNPSQLRDYVSVP